MELCSRPKLILFLAVFLHFALYSLSDYSAQLRQEEDHPAFALLLHKRHSSLVHHGGFASVNVRGSAQGEALQRIGKAVESSKARVGALKRGIHDQRRQSYAETLFPDHGGYSISVSLGTPPQQLSVVMDTGSDLVWVPCTRDYACEQCPATNESHPIFMPEISSSARVASCADPNCESLHGNETERLCFAKGKCAGTLHNCSREVCPAYGLEYVKGITVGLLLSETLTLALKNGGRRGIRRFGVGCSLISGHLPSGIGVAGFGRGGLSLPSQLGSAISDKFGYCLLGHIYDGQNQSSVMVLGNDAVPKGVRLHYTPFLKNRNAQNSAYGVYYYLGLRGISIGRKLLKLPSKLLGFDPKGNGGTIIDSGTTLSYVNDKIFKEIVGGFDREVGYGRARAIEAKTGLGLCYDISGQDKISIPGFTFHFKGGSRMSLPAENYFILVGDAMCLTIVNEHNIIGNAEVGPAVVLGNFQQQDFYILYDREENRLGFRAESCKPSG